MGEVVGSIKILLKSNGLSLNSTFEYKENHLTQISTKEKLLNEHGKKKIRVKPMNLEKLTLLEKEKIGRDIIEISKAEHEKEGAVGSLSLHLDQNIQKKLRAMKYAQSSSIKLENFKLEEFKKEKEKENEFNKMLMYVKKVKDMKRTDVISRAVEDVHSSTLRVTLTYGKIHAFNFNVYNPYETEESAQVIITTEDLNKNLQTTLNLINEESEWLSYCQTFGLTSPSDFQVITNTNLIYLNPKESLPLAFRLLSFDLKASNVVFNIMVSKHNSEQMYSLKVVLVKVMDIIDTTFTFYENAQRTSQVIFPNPFKTEPNKTTQALSNYYISDSSLVLQENQLNGNLFIKLTVPNEGVTKCFHLILYLDKYKTFCYGIWYVKIHSIQGIDFKLKLGAREQGKLTLEDNTPRTIQLYSSLPCITFPSEDPLVVIAGIKNEVKFRAYASKKSDEFALVNCVDLSTRQVVKTWQIRICSDLPEINRVIELTLQSGANTTIKYEYVNKIDAYTVYSFESSNPKLLNVKF